MKTTNSCLICFQNTECQRYTCFIRYTLIVNFVYFSEPISRNPRDLYKRNAPGFVSNTRLKKTASYPNRFLAKSKKHSVRNLPIPLLGYSFFTKKPALHICEHRPTKPANNNSLVTVWLMSGIFCCLFCILVFFL